MNKVILMGRLTRDPDVKYTQSSQPMAVARFTLAVDRKFKRENEQSADFIACIAFGKVGELVEKYLKQGTKICLEGRWQTGNYTNKEGNKVYTNDCIADSIEFAESKQAGQNKPEQPPTDADGFMDIPEGIDEELPFC